MKPGSRAKGADTREPQPRGAVVRGNRPIDQAKAAADFVAAKQHATMHDERLWGLRQKRDREMHGIEEWEELRELAFRIRCPVHVDTVRLRLAFELQEIVVEAGQGMFFDRRNIHQAYRRPEFRNSRYASFHTGPSATADIEGVLIHGAQGVRSPFVLLVANWQPETADVVAPQ